MVNENEVSTPTHNKGIVIAKKGNDYLIVKLEDIACFYTKEKLIFALDKDGKRYLIDDTLTQLELQLDPVIYFRINRQVIVSITYIKRFRTFERLRIEIELNLPSPVLFLTSQSATIAFRKWIYRH
jgi:DNA-binding LytR/AlgR family response regulator